MWKGRYGVYLKIAGAGGVIVFVALAFVFPVVDVVEQLQKRVMQWGAWSAICYPFMFAGCNVLLLPGGILSVGSGFFFGLWWGFALVMVGNSIGAAIAFLLSRRVGRDWFRKRLSQNPTLRALEPALARDSWKIIFLSQLHPLFPTSLLNYLYGLTSVRFWTYMIWVAIGRAPGLFLYTYLGTLGQYGIGIVQGKAHPRTIEYLLWGSGGVSLLVLLMVLGRIASAAIEKAKADNVRLYVTEPDQTEPVKAFS